ncbi:hypothetical protein QG37_07835 [Candidozyma auris]|uniref:Uncharacterized protein n=1 Tax=Candidozyma auris TaxID=498019 RepID=A0A0L0NP08_CANAR|nr:hypothetical protein QG37_07835 [[Candida] auris]
MAKLLKNRSSTWLALFFPISSSLNQPGNKIFMGLKYFFFFFNIDNLRDMYNIFDLESTFRFHISSIMVVKCV